MHSVAEDVVLEVPAHQMEDDCHVVDPGGMAPWDAPHESQKAACTTEPPKRSQHNTAGIWMTQVAPSVR